jgi:hypothetical protein
VVYYSLAVGVAMIFLVNWRVLLSSWRSALLVNLTDEADFVKLTWSSSVRLFLPLGPGVRTVLCLGAFPLKIVFSLPRALGYSLADAAGADSDGESRRVTF